MASYTARKSAAGCFVMAATILAVGAIAAAPASATELPSIRRLHGSGQTLAQAAAPTPAPVPKLVVPPPAAAKAPAAATAKAPASETPDAAAAPPSAVLVGALKQCGGLISPGGCPGPVCTGGCRLAQCKDAPWPYTTCIPGTTCFRGNPYYWQCSPLPINPDLPGKLSTTPGKTLAQPDYSALGKAPAKQPGATPAPGAADTAAALNLPGSAPAQPAAAGGAGAAPDATGLGTGPGSTGQAATNGGPVPEAAMSGPDPIVAAGSQTQCGGAAGPGAPCRLGAACRDGVWAGDAGKCAAGLRCYRQSAFYWQCTAQPFTAPGGR